CTTRRGLSKVCGKTVDNAPPGCEQPGRSLRDDARDLLSRCALGVDNKKFGAISRYRVEVTPVPPPGRGSRPGRGTASAPGSSHRDALDMGPASTLTRDRDREVGDESPDDVAAALGLTIEVRRSRKRTRTVAAYIE